MNRKYSKNSSKRRYARISLTVIKLLYRNDKH